MKIRIPIPRWMARRYQPFDNWLNEVAVAPRHYEVRRIDILIALGLVACVTYYWVTTGWQGAILGGLLYILITMIALWLL
jgi:hypothetical protein